VYIDIEDKDPLWLKDKGDHFYKRHDFMSAINAYSKAIKIDNGFLFCRLNRGTTFMRMRQFQACVDEMDDIEQLINAIPQNEIAEEFDFYTKIRGRMTLRRAAALAWMSQFDAAIADYEKAAMFKGVFSEHEISVMQHDCSVVKIRKQSQEVKLQGDIFFARNMLNESLEQYMKAIELDPTNEYALSNIGVIYLKR